jgi:simple sugar transport system permease protein
MSTSTAVEPEAAKPPPGEPADERLARTNRLTSLLRRPEIGAMVGALVIFLFFATQTDSFVEPAGASTWIFQASTIGIMAVAVAMLMIGGEFDLSAGVMVGTTGLTTGIMMTKWETNVWLAIGVALALALTIGALNGLLVMWTKLPSFIVTLGTFFVLQGVNLAVTKELINQVSVVGFTGADGYEDGKKLFGSSVDVDMGWLPWLEADDAKTSLTLYAATFWFLGVVIIATWTLLRTRAGNWIFAAGGAQQSARQVGVPVLRTKVGLFMTTAFAGWLVGMLSLFKTTTAQSTTGVGEEFVYIICAVVGGCLLTGGYGSAIGAAFGALIYGMVNQGIPQMGWDNDWLYTFLGVLLLLAVLVNNWVKTRAEAMT